MSHHAANERWHHLSTASIIELIFTTIGRTPHGSADPAKQAVHFHLSSHRRPFACAVPACDWAALTLGDLWLTHEVAR